jgi:tetratricopeptide (TPR) repeat protein
MMRRVLVGMIAVLLSAGIAFASWYDDYNAGIDAVRKGQWAVVVQKMSAAIKGNPKENNNARTYGNIFINYHPYYYRGLAYLRTGKYDDAVKDFEQTSGPGEIDRGSIEELMQDAKAKQAAAATPEPQPVPQPPRPVPVPTPQPVQPTAPAIDPALRQRAAAAVEHAKQRLAAAQQRHATASPQYGQALQAITTANTQLATAKTNDELNAAIAAADNGTLLADSANASTAATNTAPVPRPTAATNLVMADTTRRVRTALEAYFRGDFDDAAREFQGLSQVMPGNGWIWVFLGASQYSQYAFEADESYKSAAMQSFRKAKKLRTWKNGLPERYFSKRIRRVFDAAG